MKLKRIILTMSIILMIALILISFATPVYARYTKEIVNIRELECQTENLENKIFLPLSNVEDTNILLKRLSFNIASDKSEVVAGDILKVTALVDNFSNVEEGIYALGGKIEYDKDVFELVEEETKGIENWSFSSNDYNLNNFKFVAVSNVAVNEQCYVLQIVLKVKEDAKIGSTEISTKDVTGGTGKMENGIVYSEEDTVLQINVIEEVNDDITSDVYNIDKENGKITEIYKGTTVAEFKKNVQTESKLVFVDAGGNELSDEDVIETGCTLHVGKKLTFELVADKVDVPPVEDEYITSEVYDINKENKKVTKIAVGTTVAEFIKNIETNAELIFISAEGNELAKDDVIEKGCTLHVGKTLTFELVVDEEYIASEVYIVDKENGKITEIEIGTTVEEFIKNVETNAELVFVSAEGKELSKDDIIETGCTLHVGKTYTFELVTKTDEPVEKYIKSETYKITDEDIEDIVTATTVEQFLSNIDTNMEVKVYDKDGKEVAEGTVVGTGMKLVADNEKEYVIIVTGDIDGDGLVKINDIAKNKLHYIEKEMLEGIYFKAADMDKDGKITINDIAKMKLEYIK